MVRALKIFATSFSTVYRWVSESRRGRTCVWQKLSSGQLKTTETPKNIEQLHDILYEDRIFTKLYIAGAIGEQVLHVSYELLITIEKAIWIVSVVFVNYSTKTETNAFSSLFESFW